MIGAPYMKINRLKNLEVEESLTVGGVSAITSVPELPDDLLTLANIGDLDYVTLETVLSEVTQATQHKIGCVSTSDTSKVKVLFMTAEGAGPISMRVRDVWYSLPIVEITGDWAAGTAVIKVANNTATDPKLPYGYLQLVNNYTAEDSLVISGSTSNDGTYTLRQNATADEVGGEETFIYIYPDADAGDHDTTTDGDVVSIQDLRYMVPTGKVFLAGRVSYTLTHGYDRGLIGESDTYNGAITRPQIAFGNGEQEAGQARGGTCDVPGVFRAGSYVNVSVEGTYGVYMPTILYGIEVDVDEDGVIKDEVIVQYDIGGYVCEDYRELKVLIHDGNIGSSAASFHSWNGSQIKTDWVTGTVYAVGDVVWEDGVEYVCRTAHTAGTFADDLTAVKWEIASLDDVYEIPDGKIYIAGKISYWTEGDSAKITVGESATDNGSIEKKIFCCGNADVYAGFQDVYGRFGYSPVDFTGAIGKFVSATCSQYNMRDVTYIFGVEIDN